MNRRPADVHLYGMVETVAIRGGDLVRAAVQGDEGAFTELVARHHRDLLRVAYVICRDAALAEDSAQAAWATAWRRLGDLKDPDLVRGWLVAVAANEARRVMRARRHRLREIPLSEMNGLDPIDARSDALAGGIARVDLRRALQTLDPTDRALIALRFVGELSSEDIGAALGMSASGARGRLSRLLLRLRGDLDDD